MTFRDRTDAGKRLADEISKRNFENALVFALPRGGVPVGFEVARVLGAKMYVLPVRKLGMPFDPEFAFGAIAPGGTEFIDFELAARFGLTQSEIESAVSKEQAEIKRRIRDYQYEAPQTLTGKTVIIVDDGLATGATMKAAIEYLKALKPARVVVAVPACPSGLRLNADETICLNSDPLFAAVGEYYGDFSQTTDEEVIELVKRSRK